MITKAQSPMEEHMVRIALLYLNQPVWLCTGGAQNQVIFLTMDDVNEWEYETIWSGGIEVENVDGMKMGKRVNLEKNPKNPDIVHQNWPPGDTGRLYLLLLESAC